MNCKNHPAEPAIDRCVGCAEPFCANCLVTIHGQKYCAGCKVMTLTGQPPAPEEGTIPCKEAGEALTMAIIGVLIFWPILLPWALVKASRAQKQIDEDPHLIGSGKVTATRIVAVLGLLLRFAAFAK
jgi:hypothetical protein